MLLVAPVVTVIAHSGLTSAAPNNDICVISSLVSDPSVKSMKGNCSSVTPEEIPEVVTSPSATPTPSASVTPTPTASPSPTAPVYANLASCKQVEFKATPGVNITCEVDSNQTWQDNYKITVTSDSTAPILWSVDIDNQITKDFVRVDLDSAGPIENMTALTRQFTVVGKDRSWNGDKLAANNYAYVSKGKTLVFTMRAIWK
jgi:hypothetical protein